MNYSNTINPKRKEPWHRGFSFGGVNREHWKTLFSDIYDFFIKNPLILSNFEYQL